MQRNISLKESASFGENDSGTFFVRKCNILVCMAGTWSGCGTLDEGNGDEWAFMENPFVDCNSVENGKILAGFWLNAPEVLDDYGGKLVRVIKGELLEFRYEDDKENSLIRKGKRREDITWKKTELTH